MTRMSGFEQLSGDDWQDLCLRVLHEHHPGAELVEVPDDDRGDAGLEAFSLTGCAYQCYAPEGEPLATGARYEKQRDKMTSDVRKFIVNADKIKSLLPPDLKISSWVLLVPLINSRRLVEHSATKTSEIRAAGLSYAAADIVVVGQTLAAFERARVAVVTRQLTKFDLPPLVAVDYSHLGDELVERMSTKLGMTMQYAAEEKRRNIVNRLLSNNVAGRTHRDFVQDQYSELGDQLEAQLSDLEDRLAMQYALEEQVPDRRLLTVLRDTERAVDSILNTRANESRIIAEGQVADWLMRCPLDFV
jgi:hypothetical protein